MKGDDGGNADIAKAQELDAVIAANFQIYGIAEAKVAPAASGAAKTPPAGTADCSRAETHWKSVEEIKTPAAYEDHLARFPTCDFAILARARLDQMKK